MTRVFIALGSNLNDPPARLREAARRLGAHPHISGLRLSPLYGSDPVGIVDQPRFVNGAVELQTSLAPLELLDLCQDIENQMGRVRTLRWGPRTIDLDLILFGNLELKDPRLELPHPRWLERAFVVRPVLDLAPGLLVSGISLQSVLDGLPSGGLERLPG